MQVRLPTRAPVRGEPRGQRAGAAVPLRHCPRLARLRPRPELRRGRPGRASAGSRAWVVVAEGRGVRSRDLRGGGPVSRIRRKCPVRRPRRRQPRGRLEGREHHPATILPGRPGRRVGSCGALSWDPGPIRPASCRRTAARDAGWNGFGRGSGPWGPSCAPPSSARLAQNPGRGALLRASNRCRSRKESNRGTHV